MNVKDFQWKDDNNVAINLDEDQFVAFTVMNIKGFTDFLNSKFQFYTLVDKKGEPTLTINKEKIKYIIFK